MCNVKGGATAVYVVQDTIIGKKKSSKKILFTFPFFNLQCFGQKKRKQTNIVLHQRVRLIYFVNPYPFYKLVYSNSKKKNLVEQEDR